MPFNSNDPLGYAGINEEEQPEFIVANRAPTTNDKYAIGSEWGDKSVSPPALYQTTGGGNWLVGGAPAASTTQAGVVELSTLAELQTGTAPATAVPTANDVATVIAAVVVGAVPAATETQAGIAEIATQAETDTGTDDTRIVTPLKLSNFVGSGGFPGSFTDLTATGAVSFTGATGGLTMTSSTASSLGVTGAGIDLTLASAAGRVVINGEEAAADAVRILSAAGGLDVDVALQMNLVSSQNAADAVVINASAGGIDITAAGAAGEDIDIVNTAGSVNITAGESGTDAIVISATIGGIQINAPGAAAGEDIAITATGSSIRLVSTENVTDSIVLSSTNGGIRILAPGAAAGEDISLIATGSSVNLESTENAALAIYLHADGGTSETIRLRSDQGTGVASIDILSDVGGVTVTSGLGSSDAININASAAGGGIDVDSGTAGVIVDTTGAISLDSAAASNFTVTGAFALDIGTSLGKLSLTSGQSAADSIVISSAIGGIDILAAGAAAGEDIDIIATGSSVNIQATESDVNAITINASGVAGGINVDSGTSGVIVDTTGAISLDSAAASNFTVTGAFDLSLISSLGSVNITAGEDAADAIVLSAGAGGIDILATGAAAQDIDIVNTGGSVNISATESAADSITIVSTAGGIDILASGAAAGEDIDIVATGSSVNISATESAADSITIVSTAGGIDILASGAAAGEDIDIVATGSSINITSTENVTDAILITASGAASRVNITAGTGSIKLTSGLVVKATALSNASTPYTVLGTDYFLACDTSAGVLTVTLPAATALAGRTFVIRDVGGAAAANNITIGGGGTNLVGGGAAAATKVLSAAYSGATVYSDGTVWAYSYVA